MSVEEVIQNKDPHREEVDEALIEVSLYNQSPEKVTKVGANLLESIRQPLVQFLRTN